MATSSPATSEPAKSRSRKLATDTRNGALLQMAEAASLGLPFEVWKTRMGRMRSESTITAFHNVRKFGGGWGAFWAGFWPKLVEAGTKGAVLLVSKEALLEVFGSIGLSPTVAALAAGAGGGVAQTTVMGPCTYLVTAAVTGGEGKRGLGEVVSSTWKRGGVRAFYPGGSAIAFRQATNWASRQGITEWVRIQVRRRKNGESLTKGEEAMCGVVGGALSSWNHPFEVARIEMQARANAGQTKLSMTEVFRMVVKEHGPLGLFQGVIPRIGLNIWQTLFMVSFVHIIGKEVKK